MSADPTSSNSTSTSNLETSFSEVRKRRIQGPNMATATVASGNGHETNKAFKGMDKTSSCTSSAAGLDEQSLLPKSPDLASEEVKKSKPKPPMLNLSIRNIYYTHSSSGKSSLGSPGSPADCGLM